MSHKVCIYAICKNEAKFIEKWLENMSEADYIVVLDTGSTDETYELLKNDPRVTLVEQEVINPWRFDVARNRSMELVPEDADILVCTDFDELFEPGWAQILRDNWNPAEHNRAHYLYIWGHNENGEPQDTFVYDKIHTRDFYWKYPVHEVLWQEEEIEPRFLELADSVVLHHWQDKEKSRQSYDPLLKLACEENPEDSHIHFLYAREKLINKKYDEAIDLYQEVLKMPDIKAPNKWLVLLDAHYQLAQALFAVGSYWEVISYCQDFIYLDKTYRDPYFLMSEAFLSLTLDTLAEATAEAGFKYGIKHNDWVETSNSWLGWGNDILARAKYRLGHLDESIQHYKIAVSHEPNDIQLLRNYIMALEIAHSKQISSENDGQTQ